MIPTSAAQTAKDAGAGRTPFPIALSLPEPEDTRTRVWYTVRMRVVLQRVTEASVTVDDETVGAIGAGLVALVGIAEGDDASVVERAAAKTAALRIFRDDAGRFDRSVVDVGGSIIATAARRSHSRHRWCISFLMYFVLQCSKRVQLNGTTGCVA